MVTSRNTAWPGTQIWYQPGGLAGPNVATNEADLQSLITATFSGIYGGGELVIDGQFSAGVLEFSERYDLLTSFDVRFTNTQLVELDLAGGLQLFLNVKSKVVADTQILVNRVNTNSVSFLAQLSDTALGPVYIKNVLWNPQGNSATNVAAMIVNLSGCPDWWFEDCSLSEILVAPSALSRWMSVATVAPTELNLHWYGPNAGEITAGNSSFLFTALTGWDTEVTYGTFGGPLIDLTGISWAATAPTIVDRQP